MTDVTKVRDVCAAIERFAPADLAFDWDRIGLKVGHPDWPVRHVVVALTVTPSVIELAVQSGAEMIVSHHPVIWEPLADLRADNVRASSALELAGRRIACASAHTNLDIVAGGVNDVLADMLGLVNRRPLLPVPQNRQVKLVTFVPESHLAAVRNAVCEAGAGIIGNYSYCSFSVGGTGTFLPNESASPFSGTRGQVNEEPERRFEALVPKARLTVVLDALKKVHPYEEPAYDIVCLENHDPNVGIGVWGELTESVALGVFAERVRASLALSYVQVLGDTAGKVRSVGVLGGSGGKEIAAVPDDVEVYVTGDVGYHDALSAVQRGLAVIDAGHSGTERCIVPVLAHRLREYLPNVQITMAKESELFGIVAG